MAQKAPTPGWVLLYIEIKKFLLAKKALNIVVESQFLQMELYIDQTFFFTPVALDVLETELKPGSDSPSYHLVMLSWYIRTR